MITRFSLRRISFLYSAPTRLGSKQVILPKLVIRQATIPNRIQNYAANKDKTIDNKETKLEPKKIQSMPSQLTRLISDTRDEGWPRLSKVCTLAQRGSSAGVDMDQVEEFLIHHYRKNSGKETKTGKKKEPNFYSKHLLERWLKGRTESLEELCSYLDTNIYSQADKVKLPIKRLEYCMAVWRMAAVIENCFEKENVEALNKIEAFATKVSTEDDTIMHLIILGKLAYQKDFQGFDEHYLPGIILEITAKKDIIKSSSTLMPNLVLFVDLPKQLERLLALDLTPDDRIRLQLTNCRVLWKYSHFSASLDHLSLATEGFLNLSQTALVTASSEQSFLSLALPLVEMWREVGLTAAQQNLTPALDYLLAVSEMTAKRATNLSLLPGYVLWLAVKDSPATKDLTAKLESRVTTRLRGEKFERCFIVEGMTEETKQFFVKDFIRRLLLDTVSVPVGSLYQEQKDTEVIDPVSETKGIEESVSEPTESVPSGISQQLLDISVMELATEKKIPEMIDLIITEERQGALPATPTMNVVVELLCEVGDLYSLDQLDRLMPANSQEKENIYLATGKIKLRSLNSAWESGKKLETWVKMVEFYRDIWSQKSKGSIQLQTGDIMLKTCRSYVKLFIEETVLNSNHKIIPGIQAGSIKVASEFGDLNLLLVYWEALFFGPQFEQHQVAETLLDNMPQLVDHIQIDLVLARCQRDESNYRRLVEMCLKQKCPPYTQSRIFEELLANQTRSFNISGANETIKCAKSLDIKITADFFQDYLNAKQEVEAQAENNVYNKVKNFIFRTPNK